MSYDDKALQGALDMIWGRSPENPLPSEPVVIRAWMEYTVHHIESVMRDEDLLHVRKATVEWSSGAAYVSSNHLVQLPMGTLAYLSDEWREQVGA